MLESFQILAKMTCNTSGLSDVVDIVDKIINLIKIIVPIALILMGSIDLAKAVFAGKDDDIKKATGTLVKRLIAAVMIFLLSFLIQIIFVGVLDESGLCGLN